MSQKIENRDQMTLTRLLTPSILTVSAMLSGCARDSEYGSSLETSTFSATSVEIKPRHVLADLQQDLALARYEIYAKIGADHEAEKPWTGEMDKEVRRKITQLLIGLDETRKIHNFGTAPVPAIPDLCDSLITGYLDLYQELDKADPSELEKGGATAAKYRRALYDYAGSISRAEVVMRERIRKSTPAEYEDF